MLSRSAACTPTASHVPADGLLGLKQNWKTDLTSGLLVSLIALPLCLGIAMASGFPAFGGLITAIVGGLVVGPLCGARLSIKGPAAGLIAVAIASVEAFGGADAFAGYRMTLAVLVFAAGLQMVFALFKFGRFSDFFPASVVHGMLAAIGVIIFSKQIHPLLGVKPLARDPIPLLLEIPHSLVKMNPEVALVGVTSVIIVLFAHTVLGRLSKFFPGPLLAVLAGMGFCLLFDFAHPHNYTWYTDQYFVDEKFLVNLPNNFVKGITFPDFSQLFTTTSLQFLLMFSLIGSIESLLTVKAVDTIDPYKRHSDPNRDLLALGFGNMVAAFLGGLPMISEVVRSYANVTYGAKTRWSNVFHGACLLMYAVVLAEVIHLVPVAALAGVLCVTGYRLASPRHFQESRHVGFEQLIVFSATIIATLLTDLLVGVFIGVVVQYGVCLCMGAPLKSLVSRVRPGEVHSQGQLIVKLPATCFFGNVIGFKAAMGEAGNAPLILDFSDTILIDHTFMREVRAVECEASQSGRFFLVPGLDRLAPVSGHYEAARRLPPAGDTAKQAAHL
jgi:MFS superfamily sulfate permease-like transporter